MQPSLENERRLYIQRMAALMTASSPVLLPLLPFAATTANATVKPPRRDLPSIFGVGASSVNNRTVQSINRWLPQLRSIGVDNHRTIMAPWPQLEPQPGNWYWDNFDAQVEYLRQQGVWFGVLLLGNPAWNRNEPTQSLPVNNLTGWSEYVRQVATRVLGKATHFEVWNEPPNGTGPNQTAKDYADLLKATYNSAKSVSTGFQIGMAAKSAHINYLEQVIQAGGRDHFDYIVLHPYETLNISMRSSGGDRIYAGIVPTLRRMLERVNRNRRDVPVIFTEIGATTVFGEQFQVDTLVKCYVLGLYQGVSIIQWFEGMDGDSGPMGLMTASGVKRPAFYALENLLKYLGSRPRYLRQISINRYVTGHVLQGASGPVMFAWTRPMITAKPTSLLQPSRWLQLGKEADPQVSARINVGPSPILILDPADAFVSGPVPAQTDTQLEIPGTSPEASIIFGPPTIERSMYAVLARGLDIYGGSQPMGTPETGIVYALDPDFAALEGVAFEITVTIQRTATNGRVVIRLLYEALTMGGFKTAPALLIMESGISQATQTWRLTDAHFVNQWGYSFSLTPECRNCTNYKVTRINVRRSLV